MQHLNLCSQLDRVVEKPLSAKQQLQVVTVLFVLMLVTYIWTLISVESVSVERDQLQHQQVKIVAQLDELKARKAKLERESRVDGELALLESNIKFRRQLLNSIDLNSDVLDDGFSDHLRGLGRQHIDGMWFTEIHLQQGGQQLALIGRTRAPEYVPQYLQKLSQEKVFEGHYFRVFRLQVPEKKTHLLEFELRAFETGFGQ